MLLRGASTINNILEYLENNLVNCPEKIAVSDTYNRYTFKELYNQAIKFAQIIKSNKVLNQPIGVIANHNVKTIAMFFGVLYSGNYYVPIDPDMPISKIQMIIDDAQFQVILGSNDNINLINQVDFRGKFYSESDLAFYKDDQMLQLTVSGNDPAYMVYTSGSTGVPKGVVKSHNAVISFIEAFVKTFDFSDNEIIGNQTPFYFDASAKDIYLMLKLGCTMEILPSTLFSLPPELIDYINEKRVTYACWVPTVLSIVAQLNPFSLVVPTTLRKLYFVGEVMQIKHLKTWLNALPNIEYVNLYGSSETAGICCYHTVTAADLTHTSLPIGKAICNSRIYLVDNNRIITQPNQIGEMYIVSDALATEYFNDAEKTRLSFLRKDFGNGFERCFKTGDLAQYNEDGNLVFASRTDYQIKHMGHRIELGEIEAVCTKTDIIDHCCCIYNAAKRRIILVCKTSKNVSLSAQEIKSYLKQYLTPYMLPGKVIVLDEIPLNANGKIDRQNIINLYSV